MKRKITFLVSFTMAGIFTLQAQTVSTFEAPILGANSFWNGQTAPLGTTFEVGNASFENYYDTAYGGYWVSGWAYSNVADTTTAGYMNMYAARPGSGYESDQYAVGQQNSKIVLKSQARGKIVSGFYATNGTYSALSMKNGDSYAKKFGGTTGNDPDWFKLTIRKWYNGILTSDSVDFYLADYRFTNNDEDYIVNGWQWVDLTSLGNVDSLQFTLSSTDVGTLGINTPLFFCIDNFTTTDHGVGVKENINTQINIFPNPATNTLNINISNDNHLNISIIDITGRIIVNQQVSNEKNISLDITNLTAGIYQLKIQGNGINTNQTFIKR